MISFVPLLCFAATRTHCSFHGLSTPTYIKNRPGSRPKHTGDQASNSKSGSQGGIKYAFEICSMHLCSLYNPMRCSQIHEAHRQGERAKQKVGRRKFIDALYVTCVDLQKAPF